MVNSRSKKSSPARKLAGRSLLKSLKSKPIPSDLNEELKNADTLDVAEEMAENVFDRDHES